MTRAYRPVARAATAAATRERVIVAAGRLFADRGYAATSVRQIAGEAGVALDRVYALGPKAQVFAVALEAVLSGHLDGTPLLDGPDLEAVWSAPTLEEVVAGLAAATVAANRRGARMWPAFVEGARSDAALAAMLAGQNEAMRDESRRAVAHLVDRGLCAVPRDPARVADLIWTLGHPDRYALLSGHAGWSDEQILTDLRDEILALLRG